MARIVEVFPGPDGMVRRVKLTYKSYRPGEPVAQYAGASDIVVTRSVQRLALFVAEDESARLVKTLTALDYISATFTLPVYWDYILQILTTFHCSLVLNFIRFNSTE